MAYAAVRAKYAVHLLFVGPEFIRLQRQLFGRRTNRDLRTAEITAVGQKVFYTQNYRAVYGIEIAAGRRRIRFGSALTDEDKRWLCAEVREYLRQSGSPHFPKAVSRDPALVLSGGESGAAEFQSAANALPLKSAVVESLGHDSLIIQIPPSGRWGAWLPIALIFSFTIPAAFFFLFSGVVDGFDSIRGLRAGAEWFFALGLLVTTGLAGLVWYGALRHRYLRQRIRVDRFEIRLESEAFGKQKIRTLPVREITRVDLLEIMKINGEPRHAVRVVSAKQSFWFGSTLPEEDKAAVASLLREFVVRNGAPVSREKKEAAATANAQ